MKDSPISKLIIIKIGHQPTQYKKIIDTLPLLCTDKNYQGLDEDVQTGNNLVEADFMPLYSDAIQWSITVTHHVQFSTINPLDEPVANASCPPDLKPWNKHTSLTQIS